MDGNSGWTNGDLVGDETKMVITRCKYIYTYSAVCTIEKFSRSQMNGSPYVDMMYALCELDNVKLLVSLANSLEYNKAHE